jgi:hypothetical protein
MGFCISAILMITLAVFAVVGDRRAAAKGLPRAGLIAEPAASCCYPYFFEP